MKHKSVLRQLFLLVTFVAIVLARGLQAGNPGLLRGHSPGIPYRWGGDPPTVVIHPDAGSLGILDSGTALSNLLAAAENWEAVPSSSLRFQNGGFVESIQGPEGAGDFALSNIFDFIGVDNGGVTPIVFDSEDVNRNGRGDIFDALGLPFGVLGFGAPEFADGTRITEGIVVLNGAAVRAGDVDGRVFRRVIVHELGHLVNLAHSVVNGQAWNFGGTDAVTPDGIPFIVGPEDVEIMYPTNLGVEASTLHLDDIAILSTLYPNPVEPLQNFGSIQGRLLDQQGEPRTGGQMIVRNQSGDPILDAVSAISGNFAGFGNPNNPFTGSFFLNRLTPGGQYSLEVRETGGGGFTTPVFRSGSLPGPEEYYSGHAESHEASDDPFSAPFLIQVESGETVVADLLLNDFPVPSNDLCGDAIEVGLQELPFADTQLTQAATMDGAEIPPSCGFEGTESVSVWYSLRNSSKADIDLVMDTIGSDHRTEIQVFRGSCESLIVDRCFLFSGNSNHLAFTAEAGQDYRIRVTTSFRGGVLVFNVADAPLPPHNDDCAGAMAVALADLPFSNQINTTGATTESSEPPSTCWSDSPKSVWYSYTNTSSWPQYLFADTEGSNYETVLQAYRGSCEEAIPETCGRGFPFSNATARLTLSAQPGETLLFKATTWSAFNQAGGELLFNMETFQAPSNDDCADATAMRRSDLPFMDMVDARGAGNAPSEPETTCGSTSTPEQSHSVYYSFQNDSTLPLEMELSTAGSGYWTVLQVYTGSCLLTLPEACDSNFRVSELTFLAQPAETYLIKVSSFGTANAGLLNFSARAVGAVRGEDVELLVSSRQQSVPARSNLDYMVTVTNFGLDSASGVSIATTLPETTLLLSAGDDVVTCTQTTPTFTCQVGSLDPGQEILFPVSVSPQVAGQTSLHSEAHWDQRTLDSPSTTVVRPVDSFLTIPTSFPGQAGQGMTAALQGTGLPFVGAALVNLTDEEDNLIVEGFDSQGELTFLREEATPLPAGGQTTFLVEDLPGLPLATRTLLARGDQGELAGSFMIGNSPIDRLDGIGRSLPEARRLYLPLARSGAHGQATQLDFFNPYPEANNSIFRLFDGSGTQIAEALHSFAAWGSLNISLKELFDSPGPVDGYIEADAQQILRGFQVFSNQVALATAVATPGDSVSPDYA